MTPAIVNQSIIQFKNTSLLSHLVFSSRSHVYGFSIDGFDLSDRWKCLALQPFFTPS